MSNLIKSLDPPLAVAKKMAVDLINREWFGFSSFSIHYLMKLYKRKL